MRTWTVLPTIIVALGLVGCTTQETDSAARQAGRNTHEAAEDLKRDTESAARKAGKAAHEIATETEEAAKKAGQTIKRTAREAREGWKEAEREDKAKGK